MNDTALQLMAPPQLPGANGDAAPPVEPDSLPKSRCGHARNGKIAHLPKAIRDRLDEMLEDGFTCDQIKDALGEPVRHLTPNNFTEWRKGGHRDYLKDKFWRQEMRLRQEAYTDLVEGTDPVKLPEAGLQLSTTYICELLRDLSETDTDDQKTRVEKHLRLANAMSRLARSILQIQQYRETCAQNKSLELKRRDINQDLSDNELEILTARMDQLFRRPRKKPTPEPAPAPAAPAPATAAQCPSPSQLPIPPAPNGSASTAANQGRGRLVPTAGLPSMERGRLVPTGGLPLNVEPEPAPASAVQPPPPPVPAPSSISIENPKSKTEDPAAPQIPPPQNGESKTETPLAPVPIENRKSKIENPPERCYDCGLELPALLPNGQRPAPACRGCNAPLYPPGTLFDHCQFCGAAQPVGPDNQRLADNCRRCNNPLPPPGQRFVTQCPNCGLPSPINSLGQRVSTVCSDCRTPLPLFQPADPPTPIPLKPDNLTT